MVCLDESVEVAQDPHFVRHVRFTPISPSGDVGLFLQVEGLEGVLVLLQCNLVINVFIHYQSQSLLLGFVQSEIEGVNLSQEMRSRNNLLVATITDSEECLGSQMFRVQTRNKVTHSLHVSAAFLGLSNFSLDIFCLRFKLLRG